MGEREEALFGNNLKAWKGNWTIKSIKGQFDKKNRDENTKTSSIAKQKYKFWREEKGGGEGKKNISIADGIQRWTRYTNKKISERQFIIINGKKGDSSSSRADYESSKTKS